MARDLELNGYSFGFYARYRRVLVVEWSSGRPAAVTGKWGLAFSGCRCTIFLVLTVDAVEMVSEEESKSLIQVCHEGIPDDVFTT